MKIIPLILSLGLAIMFGGCQTTPGDAAKRAGHAEHAASLYQRGAEQGDPDAALKLGLLLHKREVDAEEYGTAADWFARSCALGSIPGCHNLGVAYEYGGDGVDVDLEAARKHYLIAAEQGYVQSQYNLASLYANEYFQDDLEGYRWMVLATTAAERCARSQEICQWILEDPPGHRKNLRSRLSDEDIAQAEQWAAAWKPRTE